MSVGLFALGASRTFQVMTASVALVFGAMVTAEVVQTRLDCLEAPEGMLRSACEASIGEWPAASNFALYAGAFGLCVAFLGFVPGFSARRTLNRIVMVCDLVAMVCYFIAAKVLATHNEEVREDREANCINKSREGEKLCRLLVDVKEQQVAILITFSILTALLTLVAWVPLLFVGHARRVKSE